MSESTELAILDPKVAQELKVVTEAISVSLAVKEITIDFAKRRDELIANSSEFLTPPTNDDEQQEIITAQRALQGLRKEVEKQAAALKSPLNAARKNIIDIEDRATTAIDKEEKRLQGLVNHRQQKLLEERRAEEAKIEAERKRLADEQAKAQREEEEAERKRRQAEIAAQQALEAKTKAERDKAAAEAQRLNDEAAKLESDAYGRNLEAEMAPPTPTVPSAPMPQARRIYDFELIGTTPSAMKGCLIALLNAHQEFFSCSASPTTPRHFTLSLKVQDLMDALSGKEPFTKLESAPGIRVTERLATLR